MCRCITGDGLTVENRFVKKIAEYYTFISCLFIQNYSEFVLWTTVSELSTIFTRTSATHKLQIQTNHKHEKYLASTHKDKHTLRGQKTDR